MKLFKLLLTVCVLIVAIAIFAHSEGKEQAVTQYDLYIKDNKVGKSSIKVVTEKHIDTNEEIYYENEDAKIVVNTKYDEKLLPINATCNIFINDVLSVESDVIVGDKIIITIKKYGKNEKGENVVFSQKTIEKELPVGKILFSSAIIAIAPKMTEDAEKVENITLIQYPQTLTYPDIFSMMSGFTIEKKMMDGAKYNIILKEKERTLVDISYSSKNECEKMKLGKIEYKISTSNENDDK